MGKTCRIQNPDILQACRVGEPGRAAWPNRARLGANRTICSENKGPTYFPKDRRHVALTSPEEHQQAKFYGNRRRNRIRGLQAFYQGVYQQLIRGLQAGGETLFVPGYRPVEQHLFVFVNAFRAEYVRELVANITSCHESSFQGIETCRFNVPPEARASKIPRKPTKKQRQCLTTKRVAFFVPGCLFVCVNRFPARHVQEPIKNS